MPIRSLSASSYDLLRALHEKPGSPHARQLLNELGATGEVTAIRDLLSLAFSAPSGVAPGIKATIVHLVAPELPDGLPELDAWMRQRGPSFLGPTDAFHNLAPDAVARLPLDSIADTVFVGLCASHWNGRVREAAVSKLAVAKSGAELPFLLWRANDWVAPVAIRARTALVARMTDASTASFVRCIRLVERLGLAKRNVLRDIVVSVETLLLSPGARPALHAGLDSVDAQICRWCWRLLRQHGLEPPIDVAMAATRRRDPVVRRLAYEVVPRDETMQAALRDPSAAIRYLALDYWIRSANPFAADAIQASLFDRAPEMRARARFVWHQRTGEEAAALYRAALPGATGTRLIGALYGMGETGASRDVAMVKDYAHHRRALVRIAAMRAGWRLDRDAMRAVVIDALFLDSPAVAREARICLQQILPSLDADALWQRGGSGAPMRRLLTMYRRLGKWDRLPYILRALSVPDAETAAFARSELAAWNDTFNKTYAPLSESNRHALMALLARMPPHQDELMRVVRFTVAAALR